MNILCISPHPDDVELNAGAFIMHLTQSHRVRLVYFWSIRDEVYAEAYKAAVSMGLRTDDVFPEVGLKVREYSKDRQKILNRILFHKHGINPDLVIAPAPDAHQDHETVAKECIRAFKTDTNLLLYSSPYNGHFQPNFYHKVEPSDQWQKNQILSIYKSQQERPYMKAAAVDSVAGYYGLQCGAVFAEAFRIYRIVNQGKFPT